MKVILIKPNEDMGFDVKIDLSNTVPMTKEEIEQVDADIKYLRDFPEDFNKTMSKIHNAIIEEIVDK